MEVTSKVRFTPIHVALAAAPLAIAAITACGPASDPERPTVVWASHSGPRATRRHSIVDAEPIVGRLVLPSIGLEMPARYTFRGNAPVVDVSEIENGGLFVAGWSDGTVCARRQDYGLDRTSCAPRSEAPTGASTAWNDGASAALYARGDRTLGLLELAPGYSIEDVRPVTIPIPTTGTVRALAAGDYNHLSLAVGTDRSELFILRYDDTRYDQVPVDARVASWGAIQSLAWLEDGPSGGGVELVVRFDGNAAVVNRFEPSWVPLPGALDVISFERHYVVLWPGRLGIVQAGRFDSSLSEAIQNGVLDVDVPIGVTRISYRYRNALRGEDIVTGYLDSEDGGTGIWEYGVTSHASRFVAIDLPDNTRVTAISDDHSGHVTLGDEAGYVYQLHEW